MKIGIITFHRAENFGALMQCYALQTYLKNLGHQVQIVDYHCKHIDSVYHIFNPSVIFQKGEFIMNLRIYLGRIRTWKYRWEKKKKYKSFRDKYLGLSHPIKHINQLPVSDIFIVGSDQVWNISLTGGVDDVFFLNKKMYAKKLAYAVSSETYSYIEYANNRDVISSAISDFSAISVREISLRNELVKYTQKPIEICIDPTFLLTKDDYKQMMACPKDDDYILVYHLIDSALMSEIAHRISLYHHKRIIEVHAGFTKKGEGEHIYNIGPTELLGYINNAFMVLTTSFHGLAFSIIYQKPFYVIDNGSFARQRNLLHALNLEDRIIGNVSDPSSCNVGEINYGLVEEKLQNMKEMSFSFLRNNIA